MTTYSVFIFYRNFDAPDSLVRADSWDLSKSMAERRVDFLNFKVYRHHQTESGMMQMRAGQPLYAQYADSSEKDLGIC